MSKSSDESGSFADYLSEKRQDMPPMLGGGEFTVVMLAQKLGVGTKRAAMIIAADVEAGRLEPLTRRSRNGNTVQAWRVAKGAKRGRKG